MLGCPIVDDINFDHLVEVLSVMFLCCKIIIFPFVLKEICGEILWDYINILFLIKLSPVFIASHDDSYLINADDCTMIFKLYPSLYTYYVMFYF